MLTDDQAATLAIKSFLPEHLSPSQIEALIAITSILSSPAPFIEDLHSLFNAFSTLYFRSLLSSTTTVTWSTRMTSCAGVCALLIDKATQRPRSPRECAVRLSEPLLKYRPRSDALNTLLHEMIHAYLFIAGGIHVRGDDPTGHGDGFQRLAAAINEHGGYEITTTHTFHDEVQSYQAHIWQCTGSCKSLPPFFGVVRRAMNRPPGPSDSWYQEHRERCDGGTWVKVAEPPPKEGKKNKGVQNNKIDQWVKKGDGGGSWLKPGRNNQEGGDGVEGGGKKGKLLLEDSHTSDDANDDNEGGPQEDRQEARGASSKDAQDVKRPRSRAGDDGPTSKRPKAMVGVAEPQIRMVECPVCPQHVPEADINSHLDIVHNF